MFPITSFLNNFFPLFLCFRGLRESFMFFSSFGHDDREVFRFYQQEKKQKNNRVIIRNCYTNFLNPRTFVSIKHVCAHPTTEDDDLMVEMSNKAIKCFQKKSGCYRQFVFLIIITLKLIPTRLSLGSCAIRPEIRRG